MAKGKYDFETSYDVVVCGGGIAGVAASLASARRGLKTCLIEKTVFTGGLATAGNVFFYLPLTEKKGKQVTFGLSEELMRESVKYGPGSDDVLNDWSKHHTCAFNPASFILALDEILVSNGVNVWFDSLSCGAKVTRGALTAVEVENKSGRGLVKGKCFVDATGDSDIAFRAGAPCAGALNHMSIWATSFSPDVANGILSETGCEAGKLLFGCGAWDDGTNTPNGMRMFNGVDSKDVSEFILTGRRLMRERYKEEQAKLGPNGRAKIFPGSLPAMADFRTTRRIESQYTLGNGEAFKHFDDCVGLVAEWKNGEEVW